jgi:hypothetical protein
MDRFGGILRHVLATTHRYATVVAAAAADRSAPPVISGITSGGPRGRARG